MPVKAAESAFVFCLTFAADAVHIQRVIDDAVAVVGGDFVLQGFDFRIVEFRYLAAFDADDVVVVVAFVQFVNRFAAFEMVALQNTRLLELGQNAVNRRNADFHTFFQQNTVHVFRTQMLFGMRFEQVQNFQTRAGHLQAAVFQLRNIAEFFHNIQYPCEVIDVIIRNFSPLAHYQTIAVGNKTTAAARRRNRLKTIKEMIIVCFSKIFKRRYSALRNEQKGTPVNKTLCLILAAAFGLAACSAERVSLFPSYKLQVIQGNELDPRAVVSLRDGMSRDQVQLLLGTPVLRDAFHTDRWDYTFNISRNGIIKERSNLTLYFENDGLARIEGDAVQKAVDAVKAQAANQSAE